MQPDLDTSERPFVLIWELTQACELACKHCRADAQPERHPRELTTAEGKALLDDAREFGENQLVVLSGGDPLAREDTVELVEYGTDQGLQMTLTPSGTTSLTPEKIEALADAGLRRMALSIDGSTAARHDGFRQEDGSFESTVAAAEAAREAGLPLQVNTTVCAETVDDLPQIRDLVRELGAVLWSVFFLVPVGRGAELEPIPAPKAEQVLEWLHEVVQDEPFGVKTTEAPHYRRVVAQQRRAAAAGSGGPGHSGGAGPSGGPPAGAADGSGGKPTGIGDDASGGKPAGVGDEPDDGDGSESGGKPDGVGRRTGIIAGDGFAFVSHVGEVYPSGFLPKSAGNVREASVVDIYRNADLFERLRDRNELQGKCGACEFRHVCGGSRSRAFAYTGDPLGSDPLCPYEPEDYDGPMPRQQFRVGAPDGTPSPGD